MELAIDTSTKVAGVALAQEGNVLAELTWRAEYNHTVQLTPAIDYVLKLGGTKTANLEALAVAIGPGSFSGLRVGLSAAKGFALALGIPLVGVGTLAVEAQPFLGWGLPICPLLDAGRGEVSTGAFHSMKGVLLEERPPLTMSLEELCASIREATLFCGEHLPAVREAIGASLGPLAVFPPASTLLRRPGHLAELGWQRLARGERDDPATLQPVYMRGPSITQPRSQAPSPLPGPPAGGRAEAPLREDPR